MAKKYVEHPDFDLQFQLEDSQKEMYDSKQVTNSSHPLQAKKLRRSDDVDIYNEQELTDTSRKQISNETLDYNKGNKLSDDYKNCGKEGNNDEDFTGEPCGKNQVHLDSQTDHNDFDNQRSYTNFSELLRDLGQESKMVILQYSQVFGDSEVYEQQAGQGIENLKGHAKILLHSLTDQKNLLCEHLKTISEVLKQEI